MRISKEEGPHNNQGGGTKTRTITSQYGLFGHNTSQLKNSCKDISKYTTGLRLVVIYLFLTTHSLTLTKSIKHSTT